MPETSGANPGLLLGGTALLAAGGAFALRNRMKRTDG
jgi:LPXTG-motif cell wall-anchored protein